MPLLVCGSPQTIVLQPDDLTTNDHDPRTKEMETTTPQSGLPPKHITIFPFPVIGTQNHLIQIDSFQDAMLDVMCQPSFTYSNASIQVISKPSKQQLIGSTSVKKQSSLMHKNMVETTKKASKLLVKSLDKMCMTNLEIEEK
jgi:hypothetical protein